MNKLLAASLTAASLLFLSCSEKSTDNDESPLASSSSVATELSSSSEGSSSSEAGQLIEDFEDADAENSLGGSWYSFSDNDGGGQSSIVPSNFEEALGASEGYLSKGMTLEASLVKADYLYAPYYALATTLPKNDKSNPSLHKGITYWHKGVAHTFRIDIPEVKDYDVHLLEVPAHKEWTLVTIDFTLLAQEGWGKPVALNLDQSVKAAWVLRKTSGAFAIDQISYVDNIVYEKENNMAINPPSPPVALEPNGDVTSALNDLSKKYLTKGLNFTNWGEEEKIDSTLQPKDWKFNEASVQKQHAQGMKGLRLPIDLDLYLVGRDSVLKGTKTDVQLEPFLYTLLDSFNIWTKRHEMSLTIDFHAYDGTYNAASSKSAVYKQAMAAIWKRVAEHFVNEKREDLFFELTNEPNLSLPNGETIAQADWKALAQMMIDSIRTVDPTRPVIFGDTDWYSLDMLATNTPFEDKYVIYAFHMYDPFVFTHQGASWSDMGSTKNIPFPYSEAAWSTEFRDFGVYATTPSWVKNSLKNYYKEGNKTFIKNRLIKAKNWAHKHQVPLICNEWGAYNKSAKIGDLNNYFRTMGEIFSELDISWQVWFGIMDDKYDLLPGMKEALAL